MRQIAVPAMLLLSGLPGFAIDPQLMSLVMPEAKSLAGVNVTSLKTSPIGEYVAGKKDLLKGPWKIIAASGFDPLEDASELLAATATTDFTRISDLVLVSGTFKVDAIAAAASGAGISTEDYRGHVVLKSVDPGTKAVSAVAFLGSSIAISGTEALVKAAVDRGGGAIHVEPALVSLARQAGARQGVWVATGAGLFAPLGSDFKNIQSFTCGASFGADALITGRAATKDPNTASMLATLLKFLTAIGAMKPEMMPDSADLIRLLQPFQAMQATVSGSDLNLSLHIPFPVMVNLFNQGMAGTLWKPLSALSTTLAPGGGKAK
jgi:hypothetical protein